MVVVMHAHTGSIGIIMVEMVAGVVVTVDPVAGMVVVMHAHTGRMGWKVAGDR